MKLTNTIRDAFVNAAMSDVPFEHFDEQRTKLVQEEAREKLPPRVRALFDDKELRGFLGTQYVKGSYVYAASDYEPSAALLKKLEGIKARETAQQNNHRELRNKLRAVALAVTTSKALAEALPEFAKYLPKDPEAASRQVPALANVVSEFVKAGWPKGKTAAKVKSAEPLGAEMEQESKDTPQHEHDCSSCVFLGRCGDHDLYFHEGPVPTLTTLVARYGERGAYTSGLAFSHPGGDPALVAARSRAIQLGYGEAIAKAESQS